MSQILALTGYITPTAADPVVLKETFDLSGDALEYPDRFAEDRFSED